MSPFFFIPVATLGTAFISGLTGLGGGAILMGFLATLLSPIQAVFLHALYQAFSNVFRLFIHWKHVDKSLFFYFTATVFPGAYVGSKLVGSMPIPLLKMILGFGLLLSLIPKKKTERSLPGFAYSILGFVSGLMGCLMGAVGPLMARFLLKPGMSHGYFVGTKSACQFVVHVGKIVFLGALVSDTELLTNIYVVMGFFGIFLGNYIAKFVGAKIPKDIFQRSVKVLLLFLGCQLFFNGARFFLLN